VDFFSRRWDVSFVVFCPLIFFRSLRYCLLRSWDVGLSAFVFCFFSFLPLPAAEVCFAWRFLPRSRLRRLRPLLVDVFLCGNSRVCQLIFNLFSFVNASSFVVFVASSWSSFRFALPSGSPCSPVGASLFSRLLPPMARDLSPFLRRPRTELGDFPFQFSRDGRFPSYLIAWAFSFLVFG